MKSLWNEFNQKEKDEYIKFLQIFGALSGLFKDIKKGDHANKPYLYYRNHEQLFTRVFDVIDLTRSDSAFDALAQNGNDKIGIGLKTWIHTRDFTFQKIAEFNKAAPNEIEPLINQKDYLKAVEIVSKLRNERIQMDERVHNTSKNNHIYHNITRDNGFMNIVEESYDLIQIDSIQLLSHTDKVFNFTDGKSTYKYYRSKSLLTKEFRANSESILQKIPIKHFDDPFELLAMIDLPLSSFDTKEKVIYLPLYSNKGKKDNYKKVVNESSGLNKWHRKRENNRPWDVELRIPKWIHEEFPGWFFGHDFIKTELSTIDHQANYITENPTAQRLPNKQSKNYVDFTLAMPDGSYIPAAVNGANGKNLQSQDSKVLGKWLLQKVFNISENDMSDYNYNRTIKMKHLEELNVDSIKLTMIDEEKKIIEISLAEYGSFDKFAKEHGQYKVVDEEE